MKRLCALIVFLSLAAGLVAQTEVIVTAQTTGCKRPLNVYVFDGHSFDLLQIMEDSGSGVYTTTLSVKEPIFRYFGSAPNDAVPLIVGGSPTLNFTATCGAMRKATVADSPLNEGYRQLKKDFQTHQTRYATLMREVQRAPDSTVRAEKLAALQSLDQEKRERVASARALHPILGRVASLNTYLSYQSADSEKFGNEIEYYVNSYFQFVDFQDPGFNELPWTYEGNRTFATNLTQVMPDKQLAELLTNIYNQWPGGSRAQFLAMSGGFAALVQRKHPGAVELAETIIQRFQAVYPKPVEGIAKQALAMRSFTVGGEAPLFTATTPSGDSLSLESLRGKVVLIDFWASWCGPCRTENPNVVRVYNRFKDRGFEILGVSLDNKKERWQQAIEADGLTWLHVSDLKGWRSQYSRLYGVNSIPHTVLVDREGKIIARNLRGATLERKLEEVFSVK